MKRQIPFPKDDPTRLYAVSVYGKGTPARNSLSIYYSPGLSGLPPGVLLAFRIDPTKKTTAVTLKVCQSQYLFELDDQQGQTWPKPKRPLIELLHQFAKGERFYLLNTDKRTTEHPFATKLKPQSQILKAIQAEVLKKIPPQDFALLCELSYVRVRDLPAMFKTIGTVGAL
jgi:hypothetical protein